MKREDLKAKGLTDEQIDFVMAENGKDINALKDANAQKDQQITALTTERDGLKTQLADRDKDIEDLKKQKGNTDELNQKLTDLQTKYDTDTQALRDKMDAQARSHAAEQFYGNVEFTSGFAKKAAIKEFMEAGLEFKDGAYVDADKFLEKQRADNPDAFKAKEDPAPAPKPKPQFADPKPNQTPPKPKPSLRELMEKKNANPDATINFD